MARSNLPDKARLFDALFDGEEMNAVFGEVAAAIGARSFLGGFAFTDGSRDIAVSSGYWNADFIAHYYSEYLLEDPWTQYTLRNCPPLRAMDLRRIDRRSVEGSRLCEEFLRPAGDDTSFVTGVGIGDRFGIGAVSFQRGADQSDFSGEEIGLLDRVAPDLGKALALRGRLAGSERQILARDVALDALQDAVILLSDDAGIVFANRTAEIHLRGDGLLDMKNGRLSVADTRGARLLADALASVRDKRVGGLRLAGRGQVLELSLLALPETAGSARVMLSFAVSAPPTREALLRGIYGLSATEAEVAVMLADGLDPADIAETRATSPHTVRAQLRAIAEKMECSRQIDIVRRIAALPRIAGEIPPL